MFKLIENIVAALYVFVFFCAMMLIGVTVFLAAFISLLLFAMIVTVNDERSKRAVYLIIFIVILGSILTLWLN